MGAQLEKRYAVRVEAAVIAGVPVRIVYPKGVAALGKGPVLLNLHGGGGKVDSGSLTETIPIAAMTGIPVVAVLYRLATATRADTRARRLEQFVTMLAQGETIYPQRRTLES